MYDMDIYSLIKYAEEKIIPTPRTYCRRMDFWQYIGLNSIFN